MSVKDELAYTNVSQRWISIHKCQSVLNSPKCMSGID